MASRVVRIIVAHWPSRETMPRQRRPSQNSLTSSDSTRSISGYSKTAGEFSATLPAMVHVGRPLNRVGTWQQPNALRHHELRGSARAGLAAGVSIGGTEPP